MIRYKKSVKVFGLSPYMHLADRVVEGVYGNWDFNRVTVTSAVDGKHGKNSLHYQGLAQDYRTTRLDSEFDWQKIADFIRAELTDEYDVVLESDHIHIEFQPKR